MPWDIFWTLIAQTLIAIIVLTLPVSLSLRFLSAGIVKNRSTKVMSTRG